MSRRREGKPARKSPQGSISRPASDATASPVVRQRPWRRRWIVWTVLAAVLLLLALVVAPRALTAGARWLAARQVAAGADNTARLWLAWSAWIWPRDGRTDLAEAVCLRHLERFDDWRRAIEAAKRKGAPPLAVEHELRLGLLQSGQRRQDVAGELVALTDQAVPPREVAAAVIFACLAQEKADAARTVLDAWATSDPNSSHVAYMTGVLYRYVSDPDQAEAAFKLALAREPRHELARQALAALYAGEHRLEESLAQEITLAGRRATRDAAEVRLAGLLRQLGRRHEARQVLLSAAGRRGMGAEVAAELGRIELDAGRYEEALRLFESEAAGLGAPESAAAVGMALKGEIVRSQKAFARIDDTQAGGLRGYDLRVRLAIDGRDRQAAEELARLSSNPSARNQSGVEAAAGTGAASAAALYAEKCAACHGQNGDANSVGARHLFPRARNLRTEPFQLVSNPDGVATQADIEEVLRRGMPGTAMRAFNDLDQRQRTLLAEEVLRLHREGLRGQLAGILSSEGEEASAEELDAAVAMAMTPGEPIAVGPLDPATPEAAVRGRNLYVALGCVKCHGSEGLGDGDTALVDPWGTAWLPRDLVGEPFKGGHEPAAIWQRIVAGMPGTPHPACVGVSAEEIGDLVHFTASLGRDPKAVQTNHQRALRAATYLSPAAQPPGTDSTTP